MADRANSAAERKESGNEALYAADIEKEIRRMGEIHFFAGPQSMKRWKEKLELLHLEKIRAMQEICSREHVLTVTGRGASLLIPGNRRLLSSDSGKEIRRKEHIVQYSASDRHEVWLLEDGTVEARGENAYLQCETQGWKDIVSVLAAPRCTYAVRRSGTVAVCGAPVDTGIERWRGIRSLACGSYHLVGLTERGTVKVASTSVMTGSSMEETIRGWSDVTAVAAGGDGTLALHADGTVSFAGRKNDARQEVSVWRNVTAIAADSVYAVGLTKDGRILIAGSARSTMLDMGRAHASEWTDVVAVSCGSSVIGALLSDGTLRLAGIIQGKDEVLGKWEQVCRPQIQLLTDVSKDFG